MQLYLHNDNNVWLTEMKLDEDNTLIEDAALTFSLGSLVEGEYGTITAATNASPIVVTSAAHGLTNGTEILIVDCVGNEAANGVHVVANATTNTFELSGTTGTAALILPTDTANYPRWFKIVSALSDVAMPNISPGKYLGEIDEAADLLPEQDYWLFVKASNYGFQVQGKVRAKVRKLGAVI